MDTHKRLVVAALLLVLVAGFGAAEIGENFEAAGISLWGGGSVFFDLGYFLDPDYEDFYWSVTVSPGFDFLVADNLALYVNPWLSFSGDKYYDGTIPGTVVDKTLQFGASGGVMYYVVSDPTASTGMVPGFGGGLGVSIDPDATDTLDGIDLMSDGLDVRAYLQLVGRLYWFLNDRLAPYVALAPRLDYIAYYRSWDGTVWEGEFADRLTLEVSLTFGMSFWIPNKKAVLFAKR